MSIMQTLMTSTLNEASPAVLVMSLPADGYAGSGTTWTDYSGNGYNGTLVNGPAYSNTVPKHFTFDRSSTQYVQGIDIGSLSTWTVESWFRTSEPLSNTEATALITTTYDNGAGTGYGVINYCIGNNGSSAYLTVGFYNNNTWYQTSGFIPTVGTWYHVVGTYDGITLRQWVNGVNINSGVSGATSWSNGGPVRVARRWDGPVDSAHYFPGDVATAKIYSGVLTDQEIGLAYDSSKTTYGY